MKQKKQIIIKKWWPVVLSAVMSLVPFAPASAQIRDVFSSMPDSLLPTLTKNNRLDMIDFIDAKMRAEVTNRLEGDSEMLSLSDDSLTLRMSPALMLTIYLLPTETAYDSLQQVVCMERTYTLSSDSTEETVRSFYTLKWRPLQRLSDADENKLCPLPRPTILKRDEEIDSYHKI